MHSSYRGKLLFSIIFGTDSTRIDTYYFPNVKFQDNIVINMCVYLYFQAKDKFIMLKVLKELKGKKSFRPIAEETEKNTDHETDTVFTSLY